MEVTPTLFLRKQSNLGCASIKMYSPPSHRCPSDRGLVGIHSKALRLFLSHAPPGIVMKCSRWRFSFLPLLFFHPFPSSFVLASLEFHPLVATGKCFFWSSCHNGGSSKSGTSCLTGPPTPKLRTHTPAFHCLPPLSPHKEGHFPEPVPYPLGSA